MTINGRLIVSAYVIMHFLYIEFEKRGHNGHIPFHRSWSSFAWLAGSRDKLSLIADSSGFGTAHARDRITTDNGFLLRTVFRLIFVACQTGIIAPCNLLADRSDSGLLGRVISTNKGLRLSVRCQSPIPDMCPGMIFII